MIYFLIVGFSGILFSALIIYFRKQFFSTIEATLGLSNAILSDEEDQLKQKNLLSALKNLVIHLGITLGIILIVFLFVTYPIWLFSVFSHLQFKDLDKSSFNFILSFSIGTIFPFLLKKKTIVDGYSEVSILLHKIILNNYFLSKKLFSLDKYFKKGTKLEDKREFLIISGLARAGTTSLTDQLFKTGSFSSLDYSNMPFLLAPNLWKKIYNPKKIVLKERKHGDKMLMGLNTVEALEEYFFKVYLNDCYVSDSYLNTHDIDQNIHDKYLKYQTLVRKNTISMYLSKNNNFILRYTSLRKLNSFFKIVFLFRKPIDHAYSLLNQHQRFAHLQDKNDFVQTYMNWLGHHEFGLNQKIFNFTGKEAKVPYDKEDINYWLKIWLNYYSFLLTIEIKDIILIEYEDYLNNPKKVLQLIGKKTNMNFELSNIIPFKNKKQIDETNCNKKLLVESNEVYNKLKFKKEKI
jgi:hypothetical protein